MGKRVLGNTGAGGKGMFSDIKFCQRKRNLPGQISDERIFRDGHSQE